MKAQKDHFYWQKLNTGKTDRKI